MRLVALLALFLGLGCAAQASGTECGEASSCDAGRCEGGRCVPIVPDAGPDAGCASGLCECTSDAECTSPAPCIDAVCVLGACQLRAYDSRCASGEYCDRRTGCAVLPDAGMPDAPPFDAPLPDAPRIGFDAGLRPVGGPCIFDRECGPVGGIPPACIDVFGELYSGAPAPPGGYCSARCMPFDIFACGDEAICIETDALSMVGWCLRRCTSGLDCRTDQRCDLPPVGALGSVTVCLPRS